MLLQRNIVKMYLNMLGEEPTAKETRRNIE